MNRIYLRGLEILRDWFLAKYLAVVQEMYGGPFNKGTEITLTKISDSGKWHAHYFLMGREVDA